MRATLLTVLLLSGMLGATAAAPAGKTEADRVKALIGQLGSPSYSERETATKDLDGIGAPALEALRQAAQAEDVEVSRRAGELVRRIERRVEADRLLQPRRVRLAFQDTPVRQAVADFARLTGFPIALEGDATKLANRRLTLDTGEVPFWEAFEQFCVAAGLVEHALVAPPPEPAPPPEGELILRKRRLILQDGNWSALRDRRLRLVDGKPPLLPTCLAGAVRVRALPEELAQPRLGRAAGEVRVGLEVTPEPGMVWQQVLDARIFRAVTDQAELLAPATSFLDAAGEAAGMLPPNVAILLDGEDLGAQSSLRMLPLRLRAPERPAKRLAELRGVVAAQVQGPPQPLVTMDNVFNAAGQTVRGRNGEAIRMVTISRGNDGPVGVRVEVSGTVPEVNFLPGRGMVMPLRRNGRRMVVEWQDAGPIGADSFTLTDAAGKPVPFQMTTLQFQSNGNSFSQELWLTKTGNRGVSEPVRLVYSGRRPVVIEVPFVLKDVPLPR